ncbi:unnamed protein product [Moneuplotes crassus]|uniref:Uncharacterized protein n=1 Tax=Euplotes crassus TaxID=5936 RepID=A0AAD1XD34_EUPCR|nr:unnamed protein product [Moneuplotes crassus]
MATETSNPLVQLLARTASCERINKKHLISQYAKEYSNIKTGLIETTKSYLKARRTKDYQSLRDINRSVNLKSSANIGTSPMRIKDGYKKYRRSFNKSSVIRHKINGDLTHELFLSESSTSQLENPKRKKRQYKGSFIHLNNEYNEIEDIKEDGRTSRNKEKKVITLLPNSFLPVAQKQYKIMEDFEPKISSKFQKLRLKMKKCSSKMSAKIDTKDGLSFSKIDSMKRNNSGVEFVNLEKSDSKVLKKSFKTQQELMNNMKLPVSLYQNNTFDNSRKTNGKAFGKPRHSDEVVQKSSEKSFNKSSTYEALKIFKADEGKSMIDRLNEKIKSILSFSRMHNYDIEKKIAKKHRIQLKQPSTRKKSGRTSLKKVILSKYSPRHVLDEMEDSNLGIGTNDI